MPDTKYFLRGDLGCVADWIEVDKETWIRAERRAGFRPHLTSDHPDYYKVCATGGFSGNNIEGKVKYA